KAARAASRNAVLSSAAAGATCDTTVGRGRSDVASCWACPDRTASSPVAPATAATTRPPTQGSRRTNDTLNLLSGVHTGDGNAPVQLIPSCACGLLYTGPDAGFAGPGRNKSGR